ncbi:MAG: A/G-specific adenine glycosylase [Anaerolineae bacterium]
MIRSMDIHALEQWFSKHKRDLPWRRQPSPYAVWISEVMLQQTQVQVVIPYFERWMQRFPSITALAAASLEEVIKMWEGLGYYSRARNLHASAIQLMRENNGQLPTTKEGLAKVKGLGPYTIGAILSFAYHRKAAAVDGNVLRVLTRLFAIEEDIVRSRTQNDLRKLAEELLPDEKPWVIMEALIELGAQVCTSTPKCHLCPLQRDCLGLSYKKADLLPFKSRIVKIQKLFRAVAVIFCGKEVLLARGASGKVMEGLYEFPYIEVEPSDVNEGLFRQKVAKTFPLSLSFQKDLDLVRHGFTRYDVALYPTLWKAPEKKVVGSYLWIPWQEIAHLPFSAGHRRILKDLIKGQKDAYLTY